MNNDLGLLVKNIPQDELQVFAKSTKANTEVKSIVNKVEVDYSWVDVLDDAVPYLDTIIRNPRRFIAQEEEIIPIEKTKKVSEESIKHLAVHTNLIQEVDEDGMVKPIKLLNIFKEETIDLYENRFIYSLITNLYIFVRNQLTFKDQSTSNKEEKRVNYEASTIYNNQQVTITMDLSSKNLSVEEENAELIKAREEKINNIKEILEGFMASKFMKTMANATPVRSPIRKTNVILKEQNFIKALELWEFLERYQIEKPLREINEEKDLTNKAYERDFGMTFFLNYGILNEMVTNSGTIKLPDTADLPKSVYEYAMKYDIDEDAFKKELDAQISKASNYKKQQRNKASNAYINFINNHNSRMRKASFLLK